MHLSAKQKKEQARNKRIQSGGGSSKSSSIRNNAHTQDKLVKNQLKASDIFSDNEDSDPELETRPYSDSILQNTKPQKKLKTSKSSSALTSDINTEKQKPVSLNRNMLDSDTDSAGSNNAQINDSSDEDVNNKKKKKNKKRTKEKKNILSSSSDESVDSPDESSEDEYIMESGIAEHKPVDNSITTRISRWISEKSYETNAKALILKTFKDAGDASVAIAYKGGKESCALLNLIKDVMDDNSISYNKLKVLYLSPIKDEIEQVKTFITTTLKHMKLSKGYTNITCRDLSEGLNTYLMTNPIHSIFIGVKSSDKYANKLSTSLQMPDGHNLTRIYPLLSWTYKDVWEYINDKNVHVSELYSFGYTSIDTMNTTIRNPYLSNKRENTFKRASELLDHSEKENWSTIHWCEGRVMRGAGRGKTLLGVPTAKISRIQALNFDDGIYIAKAKVTGVDKKFRKAIVSISSCYDMKGVPQQNLAVYIKHKYSEDFFDKQVEMGIVGLLREQQMFDSEIQLQKAMYNDIQALDNMIIDKCMVFEE